MRGSLVSKLFFFLGLGVLAYVHTRQLTELPGFNYDEAYFSQAALKIYHGQQWPLFGMNTHTMAWPSYWVALIFRIFGPSVLHYRMAFEILAIAGFAVWGATLVLWQSWFSASIFVWLAASTLSLVANHRFGIEVTSLFTFLASLIGLLFVLDKKRGRPWFVAAVSALLVLGTTTHALFIALPLGFFAFKVLKREPLSRAERNVLSWSFLLLLPFWAQMLWTSKWKLKALGMILLTLGVLFLAWKRNGRVLLPGRFDLGARIIFIGFGLVALFNGIVFFDAVWTGLLYTGHADNKVVSFALSLGVAAILWHGSRKYSAEMLGFLFCLNAFLGNLAVTLAPKSFHLSILGVLILSSLYLARWNNRVAALAMTIFCAACGFFYSEKNYFSPFENAEIRHVKFSFILLHDSSFDFLPNYPSAKKLFLEGCRFGHDYFSVDERLQSSFGALDTLLEEERLAQIDRPEGWPKYWLKSWSEKWPKMGLALCRFGSPYPKLFKVPLETRTMKRVEEIPPNAIWNDSYYYLSL